MRWPWVVGALLAIILPAATVPQVWPGLGDPGWHHAISLVVTLALFLAFLGIGRNDARRHLALAVAVWSVLAIASGFLILYLKEPLRGWGYIPWAKFWHVAWSWFALWAAIGHTWVNRHGLLKALSGIRKRAWHVASYHGPLILVLLAIPITWSTLGGAWIREENYIPLTLWTWLAMVSMPYAVWLAYLYGRRRGIVRPTFRRPAVQHFVDAWLIPMTLLANISGIPILWFATKDTSLKYVAKYWHTWPSIAMAILVFAHTIQFWPGMVAHWKRRFGNRGPSG